MAVGQAPVWITEAGSLGVVPEGKFYRISLEAEDPDFPGDPTKVTYSLIAGQLPAGVQVNTNGTIEGIPVSVADFKGVPTEVSENTTSKFAIRVVDESDRVADRTFTLTVTGQDKPEWITPAGEIGEYFDGSEFEFQFEAEDVDPTDEVTISLAYGQLPPGLTLDPDGKLHGFLTPQIDLETSATPGWDVDGTLFDEYPYDFSTRSISKNYEFTLQASDGKDIVMRTFSVFVYSRNAMTADSIELTADMTNVTADSIAIRSPYITNNVDSIGNVRHDNYFAHKFEGKDPNGDEIEYYVPMGYSLPPGLTLDTESGWLYGYLPDVGLTEQTYDFAIKVRKVVQPTIESLLYTTSLSVYGDIETGVTWLSPSDLGSIDNGSVSILEVRASHPTSVLQYRLKEGGIYNKLPQGLQLASNGDIIGRVSFKTFSLDNGTTTFDEEHGTRLDADPTTFDRTYTFTVEAYSQDGFVSVTKDFTILINREYDTPHNILYCKAMPPVNDRELLDTFLLSNDVIPPSVIYRPQDPNFGSAKRVIYYHAFGLTPATIEDYFNSLSVNHYNKKLVLGEIKTARALDDNGDVLYEVVYSQVVDKLVNQKGESVSKELDIKYPALHDGSEVTTVYPNSLHNMREQVVDQIGQESKVLPRWMLSKQENGEVLGFTPAWVIAYTKPGKSKFLQYKIKEFIGTQLNLIDFEIDRYTLDSRLSEHWDLNNQEWLDGQMTTFDRTQITADSTQQTADDDRYNIDTFVQVDHPPLPPGYEPRDPGPYGNPYETIFDGGSCRFASPIDEYIADDRFDRYIKFPQELIVNNKQE